MLTRHTVRQLLTAAAAGLAASCGSESHPTASPTLLGARSPASKVTLTVGGTGSTAGGTVTSNRGGLSCTITYSGGAVGRSGACERQYKTGTIVTLTAASSGGSVVAGWTGCTDAAESHESCAVTLDVPRRVDVVYAPAPNAYALTILGGAGGSGTVTSTPQGLTCTIAGGSAGATGCAASFAAGGSVTLSATAAAGSYLKAWAGAGCEATGTGVNGAAGTCVVSMSRAHSVIVSFEASSTTATSGRWSAPAAWGPGGGVAIHAHLLPNGRVLTFGRHHQRPVMWDPRTGTFSSLTQPVDLFCSGHAFLSDGRLLTAGGHSGTDNLGLVASTIFDFSTGTWTRGPDMRNGRWYPTNTTLANGEILTVSGGDTAQLRNEVPEVYQPSSGSWRALARLYLPYYPFMFVVPTGARAGHVFVAGPSKSTYFLNPAGAGAWSSGPASLFGDRSYGTAAMYDVGKVLLVGGGGSTATAEVVDLTAGTGWRYVGSMRVARRQLNATVLADGTVLVTGGTNSTAFNSAPTTDAVLAAELWNPATEQWTQLARMARQRLYHAVALLLPDGRVLSTGSGEPAASGLSDDYSYEVFTPPYLLNADGTAAPRPTITSAPTAVAYGASFTVGTPDASAVRKVTWVSLGSVTHAFNMNQRFMPLSFTAGGASALTVTAPRDGNHAPPGYYLLFVVNDRGVPSEAKIVRIGGT